MTEDIQSVSGNFTKLGVVHIIKFLQQRPGTTIRERPDSNLIGDFFSQR